MLGSSHLAQKYNNFFIYVAWIRHQTYVGTFRDQKISYINIFRKHAVVIWKEQSKYISTYTTNEH